MLGMLQSHPCSEIYAGQNGEVSRLWKSNSNSQCKNTISFWPVSTTGSLGPDAANESPAAKGTADSNKQIDPDNVSSGIQVLESRAVPAVWLLRITLLALASNGFISWRLYQTGRPTGPLETAQEITSVVQLILFIVATVFFLRWKYQACSNLHSECESRLKFSPSGCCLYYLFPVFNLFYPMRAMLEIQSRSKADVGYMVYVWWVLWILSCLIAQKIFRTNNVQFEPLCIASIVCFSMAIVAGFFLIKIIKAVTEKQRRYRLAIENMAN